MSLAELPCPACEGWMARRGDRWTCTSCGFESDPVEVGADGGALLADGLGAPDLISERRTHEHVATDLGAAVARGGPDLVAQGLATSSPPRPPLAGRPRSFWVCLLLGIVTLGVYYLYWQWAVFHERHRQQGTVHRTALYWASLVLPLLGVAIFLVDVGEAFDDGGSAADVPLPPLMVGLSVAGTVAGAAYLIREGRLLQSALQGQGRAASATGWLAVGFGLSALSTLVPAGGASIAVGVLSLPFILVAFSILQSNLNEFWGRARTRPSAAPTGLTPAAG